MGLKKNGTIAVADLALSLIRERIRQIKSSGELPDRAQYTFDELDRLMGFSDEVTREHAPAATVCKTTRRTVVTRKYGAFEARHVMRQSKVQDGSSRTVRSAELARLVAPGCRYGYDLVAHVGLESFLHGRRLEDIHKELQQGSPPIRIPTSSLDELRRRFLFYLGQVHRRAATALRESFAQPGGLTWLIDGTVEPGTPVFFGIQEARTAILLGCWKIPTENTDEMAPCLTEAAHDYGQPKRILHDLSSAMSLACETAFPEISHDVCHFHFARDVGEDLLAEPQKALSSRLRSLKLQVCLREQRKSQTEWLREHAGAPEATLVLERILRGEELTEVWSETVSREVLLAFHFWMLDYAADGGRQGFPFDPYFLYFHRRLIQGHNALVRLLSRPVVAVHAAKTLCNLRDQLGRYCGDPQIIAAASHYEIAFREFDRLRTVLRLCAVGTRPMYHGYDLTADEQKQVREGLDGLRDEYRHRVDCCLDEVERDVCTIILSHLEKYLPQLLPLTGPGRDGVRTTNQLEGHWSQSKRACRHTQGRRKLTRSFAALPAELMLIPNLRNPQYTNVVLGGSLDHLATQFADADSNGTSYASWRHRNASLNIGRLPARLLRAENLIDHLLEIYDGLCHRKNRQAA